MIIFILIFTLPPFININVFNTHMYKCIHIQIGLEEIVIILIVLFNKDIYMPLYENNLID